MSVRRAVRRLAAQSKPTSSCVAGKEAGIHSPGTDTAGAKGALALIYRHPDAVCSTKTLNQKYFCLHFRNAQLGKHQAERSGSHERLVCQKDKGESNTGDASEEREQQQPTPTPLGHPERGTGVPNLPSGAGHGKQTMVLHSPPATRFLDSRGSPGRHIACELQPSNHPTISTLKLNSCLTSCWLNYLVLVRTDGDPYQGFGKDEESHKVRFLYKRIISGLSTGGEE